METATLEKKVLNKKLVIITEGINPKVREFIFNIAQLVKAENEVTAIKKIDIIFGSEDFNTEFMAEFAAGMKSMIFYQYEDDEFPFHTEELLTRSSNYMYLQPVRHKTSLETKIKHLEFIIKGSVYDKETKEKASNLLKELI